MPRTLNRRGWESRVCRAKSRHPWWWPKGDGGLDFARHERDSGSDQGTDALRPLDKRAPRGRAAADAVGDPSAGIGPPGKIVGLARRRRPLATARQTPPPAEKSLCLLARSESRENGRTPV